MTPSSEQQGHRYVYGLHFPCFLSSGNTRKAGESYDYSSVGDWHYSTLPPTDRRHDIKIIISQEQVLYNGLALSSFVDGCNS